MGQCAAPGSAGSRPTAAQRATGRGVSSAGGRPAAREKSMRAAVMRGRKLVVDEIPAPVPGPGQVRVRTLACGICGSDLHALRFADRMVEASVRAGSPLRMDLSGDIVMGHE